MRRNVKQKPSSITPKGFKLADGSGARSDETTIFLEVGLVMSGSRSQLRSVKNPV